MTGFDGVRKKVLSVEVQAEACAPQMLELMKDGDEEGLKKLEEVEAPDAVVTG